MSHARCGEYAAAHVAVPLISGWAWIDVSLPDGNRLARCCHERAIFGAAS